MDHAPLPRRYLIFFAGVVSSALGIALITLAGMGTSAVSSLAYVLTFVFPGVSLGCFTFLVNCIMLGGQALLLHWESYSGTKKANRLSRLAERWTRSLPSI